MRASKLNQLLHLWEKNGLVTSEQCAGIAEFMKRRREEQFFRLIKWLFVLGAFWTLFGCLWCITIVGIPFESTFRSLISHSGNLESFSLLEPIRIKVCSKNFVGTDFATGIVRRTSLLPSISVSSTSNATLGFRFRAR